MGAEDSQWLAGLTVGMGETGGSEWIALQRLKADRVGVRVDAVTTARRPIHARFDASSQSGSNRAIFKGDRRTPDGLPISANVGNPSTGGAAIPNDCANSRTADVSSGPAEILGHGENLRVGLLCNNSRNGSARQADAVECKPQRLTTSWR